MDIEYPTIYSFVLLKYVYNLKKPKNHICILFFKLIIQNPKELHIEIDNYIVLHC